MSAFHATYDAVTFSMYQSPDFAERFGRRLRACGGKVSKQRGGVGPQLVCPQVPESEPELLDDLARAYLGRGTLIVQGISGVPYADLILESRHRAFAWSPETGEAPSAMVARRFGEELARTEWQSWGLDPVSGVHPREVLAAEIEDAMVAGAIAAFERSGMPPSVESILAVGLQSRRAAAEVAATRYPGPRGAPAERMRLRFVEVFGADRLTEIENEWAGGRGPRR